jgi:hypothetical protein
MSERYPDPAIANLDPSFNKYRLGAFWVAPAALTGGNVFLTRLHVRYDAAHVPEDLMFQETADRSNFQGRFILRHPYTGQAQCPAGDAYRRSLEARVQREAVTLSRLTGWDLPTIAEKMRASTAAPK